MPLGDNTELTMSRVACRAPPEPTTPTPVLARLKPAVMSAEEGTGQVAAVFASETMEISDRDLTRLILACKKGKQWRKVLEMMEAVEANGVVPGFFSYSASISVCCKSRRVGESLAVFQEMKRRATEDASLRPDAVVYRLLISCCVAEQEFDSALELFREMCQTGLEGDDQTLVNVLTALVNKKEWDEAVQIVDKIHARQAVLPPNQYERFIEGCAAEGNLAVATEVFLMMQMVGVEPGEAAAHHVMEAIENSNCPELGVELLESMQGKGFKVPLRTYTCLLRAVLKSGEHDLLHKVSDMMDAGDSEGGESDDTR